MVELADARDSKSRSGNRVRVRPPPPAPRLRAVLHSSFLSFAKGEKLEGMETLYLGKLNGDPTSTFMWGLQMISGKNCPKDRTAGVEAIITAAELGCIPAVNYVQTHISIAFVKAVEGAVIHRISHSLSGMTTGGEVASFINNSDQLHSYSGQLEREIEAYMNGKSRIAQKSI